MKKAYYKSKEEREKLKQELEKFQGKPAVEESKAEETLHKYEQLKNKYRVSSK